MAGIAGHPAPPDREQPPQTVDEPIHLAPPFSYPTAFSTKIKSEAINARFPFLGLSDSIYLNHSLKLPVPIFSSIARFSSVLENNELFAFLLV